MWIVYLLRGIILGVPLMALVWADYLWLADAFSSDPSMHWGCSVFVNGFLLVVWTGLGYLWWDESFTKNIGCHGKQVWKGKRQDPEYPCRYDQPLWKRLLIRGPVTWLILLPIVWGALAVVGSVDWVFSDKAVKFFSRDDDHRPSEF